MTSPRMAEESNEKSISTVKRNLNTTLDYISASLLDPSLHTLNSTSRKVINSGLKTTTHKRAGSTLMQQSRYANIPTENLKFRAFIDALFQSKMTQYDVKEEVKGYVSALETNYTDTIKDLRAQMETLKRKLKLARSEKTN